jgi:hypothetical protein
MIINEFFITVIKNTTSCQISGINMYLVKSLKWQVNLLLFMMLITIKI